MTDRDVIWVNPEALKTPRPHGQVFSRTWRRENPHSSDVAFIPLARATQLQQAMTVIAEGLEEHLANCNCATSPFIRDDHDVIADAVSEARKALTEFRR